MLPRHSTQGSLLKGHSGTAVWQRCKNGRVVGAVDQKAGHTNQTVEHPDASGDNHHVDNLFAKVGLMEADHDDGNDPEADMDIVKELVPPPTNDNSRKADDEEGGASNFAIYHTLFPKDRDSSRKAKVGRVAAGMDDDKDDARGTGDLMEDIEALIRPSCEECQRSVL